MIRISAKFEIINMESCEDDLSEVEPNNGGGIVIEGFAKWI